MPVCVSSARAELFRQRYTCNTQTCLLNTADGQVRPAGGDPDRGVSARLQPPGCRHARLPRERVRLPRCHPTLMPNVNSPIQMPKVNPRLLAPSPPLSREVRLEVLDGPAAGCRHARLPRERMRLPRCHLTSTQMTNSARVIQKSIPLQRGSLPRLLPPRPPMPFRVSCFGFSTFSTRKCNHEGADMRASRAKECDFQGAALHSTHPTLMPNVNSPHSNAESQPPSIGSKPLKGGTIGGIRRSSSRVPTCAPPAHESATSRVPP